MKMLITEAINAQCDPIAALHRADSHSKNCLNRFTFDQSTLCKDKTMPNKGDLRVWHIPQVPMDAFHVKVATLTEAKLVLDSLAYYDIFQFEKKVKPDYSNAGGIQIYDSPIIAGGDPETGWMDWTIEDSPGFEFALRKVCPDADAFSDDLLGRILTVEQVRDIEHYMFLQPHEPGEPYGAEGKWKNIKGEVINIEGMTNLHVTNAILWINRAIERALSQPNIPYGKIAGYTAKLIELHKQAAIRAIHVPLGTEPPSANTDWK